MCEDHEHDRVADFGIRDQRVGAIVEGNFGKVIAAAIAQAPGRSAVRPLVEAKRKTFAPAEFYRL
jgi:hypothetical protein